MNRFCDLALPCISQLHPYQPGKPITELQRELGISEIVKLASNENPLGPAPAARQAIMAASEDIARYPDGNGFSLKQALSTKYGISSAQIILGNGSNDVLELIARVFVSPQDEVVFSQYAFAVYPIVTQAIGARAVVAPAKNYGHDLHAMAERITPRTRLVFIANPNNPTGTWLKRDELESFIQHVPDHVIVVLDEAYIEYGDDGQISLDWLAQYPQLVITRTFSKAYGLAGLRVGYALSHPDIADLLNRVRQPFNVNSLALCAAEAALSDEDFLFRTRQVNTLGMQQLQTGLAQLQLETIPSKGNFITVHVRRNGEAVFNDLLHWGIIVRPLSNYGLSAFIRISVGLPEENARLLTAMEQIV